MINRREFLAISGCGLALMALPVSASRKSLVTTFELRAGEGTANLTSIEGMPAGVWQYNGQTPGPAIRVRQGETLRIAFNNGLSQATSVHWHGLRIDNRMDGVPGMTQSEIAPGEGFVYEFTPPDAGTFWYHTHSRSWEQLARGLYGPLIVEEREPINVDQDLVWVIDDWLLDDSGKLRESSLGALHDWAHGGRLGNQLTVNGRAEAEFPVMCGERIRLRLVNVANARIMTLRFKGDSPLVIAIDGQPVPPSALKDNVLVLAPGQRMDLLLDMEQDPGQRTDLEFFSGDASVLAASLVYDSKKVKREHPLDTPIQLPPNPLPSSMDLAAAKQVGLAMEGGAMGRMRSAEYQGKQMNIKELVKEKKIWAFNGVAGLPEKPLFSVKRGETAVIDMDNQNRWPHAMHVHGHHFKALDDKDQLDPVWRDTLLLQRGERQRIALVADNPGKWLIHCHMIEHQAGGMVTWFEVV